MYLIFNFFFFNMISALKTNVQKMYSEQLCATIICKVCYGPWNKYQAVVIADNAKKYF